MSNYVPDLPLNPPNEPHVTCANCGNTSYYHEMKFDHHTELDFCDRLCFEEWADAHPETVLDFYYDRNID